MRANWKYIAVLLGLFAVLIGVEVGKPRPLDWRLTLSNRDRIPYGSFLLYEMLPDLFPVMPLNSMERPLFLTLREESRAGANLIFISDALAFDPSESDLLLAAVDSGASVFASAMAFEGPLADSLGLSVAIDFSWQRSDTLGIRLSNPRLDDVPSPHLPGRSGGFYFEERALADAGVAERDSGDTRPTVLGRDDRGRTNFVRIPWGAGAFYLHCLPQLFTNYHVLDPVSRSYVGAALSHLPVRPTLWDEYYKPGRAMVRTPLRYVLSQTPLRNAWYLTLGAIVLFMLFMARRRQRIIPVIEPVRNTTVDFVNTVARLYWQKGDHHNLAVKKIQHFLDHIRQHYFIATDRLDDAFIRRVARRSGLPPADVEALFRYLEDVRRRETLGEAGLRRLHQQIDHFYRTSGLPHD